MKAITRSGWSTSPGSSVRREADFGKQKAALKNTEVDLVQTRAAIDEQVVASLAARTAAEKIDRGNNRQLFIEAAQPLTSPNDARHLDHILDERARFYQVMLQIADNAELERAMQLGRAHLFRTQFYRYVTKTDLRLMVPEYRNIANAILDGNAPKAEMYARRHIRKTAERTLPHLR
ncbi:MAG: FCD domain-containing protein [Xanthobacteraceae bacterium]